MKISLSFLVFFYVFSLHALAQGVPDGVRSAFQENFEEVRELEWSKKEAGKYQVAFTRKGEHFEVLYDDQGNKLEEKKEVQKMPDKVISALEESYPAYESLNTFLITTSKAPPFYEVLLAKGEKNISVRLDKNGRVLE